MSLPPLSTTTKEQTIEITGFARPFGLKVIPDGTAYVTDMDLHAVFRIAPDFRTYRVLVGPDGWSTPQAFGPDQQRQAEPRGPQIFNGPHSLDISADGDMCITTYYTPALHFVAPNGRIKHTAQELTAGITLTGPATSNYTPDGTLLIAEYTQNSVIRWHPHNGQIDTIGHTQPDNALFERLHMAKQLGSGKLIVADTWHHRLVLIDQNGMCIGWWRPSPKNEQQDAWNPDIKTDVGSATPGNSFGPVAVDEHPLTGDVLVTDWGNNRLLQLRPEGRIVATLDNFDLKNPYDARFYGNGLVIADSHHGRVLFINTRESQ